MRTRRYAVLNTVRSADARLQHPPSSKSSDLRRDVVRDRVRSVAPAFHRRHGPRPMSRRAESCRRGNCCGLPSAVLLLAARSIASPYRAPRAHGDCGPQRHRLPPYTA